MLRGCQVKEYSTHNKSLLVAQQGKTKEETKGG